MKNLITILLLLVTTFSIYAHDLILRPDLTKSPGFFCTKENQDFKELRYKEQIAVCKRNVSVQRKNKVYASYGIQQADKVTYTIDHVVPLSMGGSNDELNLWPQHKDISSVNLEFRVFKLIEADKISHKEALDLIYAVKK